MEEDDVGSGFRVGGAAAVKANEAAVRGAQPEELFGKHAEVGMEQSWLERRGEGFRRLLGDIGIEKLLSEKFGKMLASRVFDELFEGLERVNYSQFIYGMKGIRSVQQILQASDDPPFGVPVDFDSNKSTYENYVDLNAMEYVQTRKIWHEEFLRKKCPEQNKQPGTRWVVFACGPRYCGTSQVLRYMNEHSILPLKFFVRVSKFHTCLSLPEWQSLAAEKGCKTALALCQDEADYLNEQIIDRCLECSQNMFIDREEPPSLEEMKRYKTRIGYKICVIHVLATKETLAERQGLELSSVLDQSGDTIEVAEAKARATTNSHQIDLRVFVNNDSDTDPSLIRVEDRSPTWHCTLGRHFSNIKEQPSGFPAELSSLYLESTTLAKLVKEGTVVFKFTDADHIHPIQQKLSSVSERSVSSASSAAEEMVNVPMTNLALSSEGEKGHPRPFVKEAASKKRSPDRDTKKIMITACSPADDEASLEKAVLEANKIRERIAKETETESNFALDISEEDFQNSSVKLFENLQGKACWHLATKSAQDLSDAIIMHFDDKNEDIFQNALVDLASRLSSNNGADGSLELIFINGCQGEELARRFTDESRIPFVIYWRSKVDEEAAFELASLFWTSVCKNGDSYESALMEAQTAVATITQESGDGHKVQKFKMQVSPKDPNFDVGDTRRPAGIVACATYAPARVEVMKIVKAQLTLKKGFTTPAYQAAPVLVQLLLNNEGCIDWLMSPTSPVNLDHASREKAGIPDNAALFSWAYPVKLYFNNLDESSPDVEMFKYGAYLYFDQEEKFLVANTVSANTSMRIESSLDFDPPESLDFEDASELCKKDRWFKVTLPEMLEAGAKWFCWILPRERLPTRIFPQYGAFAYLFRDKDATACDERDRIFAVRQKLA